MSLEDKSEAVDARKWSAKRRNWNISEHILFFEFNRGAKAAEKVRNICGKHRAMPLKKARQENGFLVLRRIILTLVTLHIQEDFRGLMKIV